jgi:biopolymer transport protein ExbD
MAGHGSDVKSEPNLTPMLDMVFQLVTFFMLVINFKSAELDLNLKLPFIGSARPVSVPAEQHLLVLNIKEVGGKTNLTVSGGLCTEEQIKPYIVAEAATSRLASRIKEEEIKSGEKELPDIVVIRTNEATPFRNVYFVITTCQEQGFRKFALMSRVSK